MIEVGGGHWCIPIGTVVADVITPCMSSLQSMDHPDRNLICSLASQWRPVYATFAHWNLNQLSTAQICHGVNKSVYKVICCSMTKKLWSEVSWAHLSNQVVKETNRYIHLTMLYHLVQCQRLVQNDHSFWLKTAIQSWSEGLNQTEWWIPFL